MWTSKNQINQIGSENKMVAIDSEVIDRIGLKEYYKAEKKRFIQLCKQRGLSQSKTVMVTNIWLMSECQKDELVNLSYVKRYWKTKVKTQ